jgi:high-affinity nickel-transport protein
LFALVLGVRHGLDADHLAVVDGVTRLNTEHRPRLARIAGALFSAGHCAVVIPAVLGANLVAGRVLLPGWLELSGTLVSVLFLLVLTLINVITAFATPAHAIVRPIGVRARWLAHAPMLSRPFGVFAIGMLFAVSFDTLSQALLFSVVGGRLGGGFGPLAASLCFAVGMLAVDGINGLWLSRLIRAADRRAALASRVMAGAVSVVGLSVCGYAFSRSIWPAMAQWGERNQLWLGTAIVAVPVLVTVATRIYKV